jgi:hypothetical protein
MESDDQKKIRFLIQIEKSKPKTILEGRPSQKTIWTLPNGDYHRDFGPAIESKNWQAWYQHGALHRENGPAEITPSEIKWARHGKLHREDGPAFEQDKTKMWFYEGKLHREDGPAIEAYPTEWSENWMRAPTITWTHEWWINDERHREDGPAVVRSDGSEEYWISNKLIRIEWRNEEGKLHRTDGPAIEVNPIIDENDISYYLDDKKLSPDEFNSWKKKNKKRKKI